MACQAINSLIEMSVELRVSQYRAAAVYLARRYGDTLLPRPMQRLPAKLEPGVR